MPLSSTLPPLILGTATFNSQYNPDPYTLPTTSLIHRALESGIRAFDTSPYYGPAEILLGHALNTPYVQTNFPRSTYHLLTKVGRVGESSFDYSPEWIRKSLRRSLRRLRTTYLDVVYCHDVEFVSPHAVLTAVRELRRIRDEEGSVKYIGISAYPVDKLVEIAELVVNETGCPLDVVMSYGHFTLQNTALLSRALPRLRSAGVDVVPNASPLGMGLLRSVGVPVGGMGDFHPAPVGLRDAVRKVGEWVWNEVGEKLEVVAVRFALEEWLREGGFSGDTERERRGVSVVGVSSVEELDETMRIWRSILDAFEGDHRDDSQKGNGDSSDQISSRNRRDNVQSLFHDIQRILGPQWVDYSWASPPPGFVNSLSDDHVAALHSELDPEPTR